MMFQALALFLGFFALYARTTGPHVVPYRDAGEMVSVLATLGVAHPPGYPLYTLLGRLVAHALALGNFAYRANIFSALCAAAALAVFYLALRAWLKPLPALAAVLALGFSHLFWELACVPEMYTLGVLWLCLLFYATFRLENAALCAFLLALGLGVRMDLLLVAPVFIAWFWFTQSPRQALRMAPFFVAGGSVFLFLLLRSRTDPWLDWGNPDTLAAVFRSATRKSYSGTLDLLSLSYKSGENFGINLTLYGRHLQASLGWLGCALALAGAWRLFKTAPRAAYFFGALFAVTGPLFLYLSNMPPNPHSIAIIEASYLVPNVVVAALVGWGVSIVPMVAAQAGILAVLVCLNAPSGYARADKRHNFYLRDYTDNVWRSLPKNSVGVFHKDVQLFSLWASQLVDRRRPDVSLVSTGLSASPWFWQMKRRWPAGFGPEVSLKETGGWKNLVLQANGRPVMAGFDVDGSPDGPDGVPGVSRLPVSPLWVTRGRYVYGETPDFFSTDLIGDHARAYHKQGLELLNQKEMAGADWFFHRAEVLDPTFSRASADRGYLRFMAGDFVHARDRYEVALRKAISTLDLTVRYKSLPEVAQTYKLDAAAAYVQVGAVYERMGQLEDARRAYWSSLNVIETAQANYNLAVTYWGHDWQNVIQYMTRALALDPTMQDARKFLAQAQTMAAKQ